eukprot:TRINITY_DN9671_c0_g1_i1.p2 TRINITY_DN9671_c0_g1~~TRINITY_DN9671_c0_g1_i1.p2  ORF type:complete len:197 (+),score=44.02 TRINITY_DN9671_c0_g1_i1:51-593(+)
METVKRPAEAFPKETHVDVAEHAPAATGSAPANPTRPSKSSRPASRHHYVIIAGMIANLVLVVVIAVLIFTFPALNSSTATNLVFLFLFFVPLCCVVLCLLFHFCTESEKETVTGPDKDFNISVGLFVIGFCCCLAWPIAAYLFLVKNQRSLRARYFAFLSCFMCFTAVVIGLLCIGYAF